MNFNSKSLWNETTLINEKILQKYSIKISTKWGKWEKIAQCEIFWRKCKPRTKCETHKVKPHKVHYVRKSYRNFKKSCPNHVLISHFRPYWLVRHHLWTINPQCKFEEIFWNHQKYTIFDENSCLALPITSYLVRFGKICLATASTR